MSNEVNVQRSKLLPDGMLHIEFLDGNSYLYSLQEIADIIADQQILTSEVKEVCVCGDDLFAVNPDGNCAWCKFPHNTTHPPIDI